ncbi:MAG TPA: hypothetical protein VHX65_16690 [Pirellulales bacterium]|jgi:hypothetical protein|nr:hypothetical protein [Pirellulales bacterium]
MIETKIERADREGHDLKALLRKSREQLEREDAELRVLELETRASPDCDDPASMTLGQLKRQEDVAMRRAKWRLDSIGLAETERSIEARR